jgi:HSP20 family molecular chaperone IbpA
MNRIFLKCPSHIFYHSLSENINISYPEQRRTPVKEQLVGKDQIFRTAVDIHDFKREEVTVKTAGHTISISAAHEEKDDEHGSITRSFNKKFVLPFDLDMEKISAWISKGILYVKVPPKSGYELAERIVNIRLEEK